MRCLRRRISSTTSLPDFSILVSKVPDICLEVMQINSQTLSQKPASRTQIIINRSGFSIRTKHLIVLKMLYMIKHYLVCMICSYRRSKKVMAIPCFNKYAQVCTSVLKLDEDSPLPTVNQPDRILWSSPKSSSLLRPRAKCSIILYMSSGFWVEPAIPKA